MSHPALGCLIALVFAVLVPGFASRAAADSLAPKKPSDLRVIGGNASSPLCTSGAARAVGYQYNSDGTVGTFSIPAGSVFVVTSWDWKIAGATPSEIQSASLVVDPNTGAAPALMSFASAQTNGSGDAAGNMELPVGAAVKPGATLCFLYNGTSVFVTVHGFMAKDK